MREILFRGAQKVDDAKSLIWYEGSLIIETDSYTGEKEYYIQNENGSFLVIPETVGQYTGLTDNNGKKIFEGDILEFSEDYDDKFGYPATSYGKCIVIYDESLLAWRIRGLDYEGLDDLCEYADSEVISNIHDNPELLKETDNE